MKRASHFAVAACLSCSLHLFPQTAPAPTEKKDQPAATASKPDEQSPSLPTVGTPKKGSLEILSDTKGVDFGPYLARVLHDVRNNWYNLVPDVARAPEMKKGKVSIEFAIMKNGSLRDMNLKKSSGDGSMDRAAWGGITASNPFPPLPAEYSGNYLALRFHFYYNPDTGGITVSPRYIRVVCGRTQQFSAFAPTAEMETAEDKKTLNAKALVKWKLFGPGCMGDDCGTISGDGLYTAPATMPHPPSVTVKATLVGNPAESASAVVIVVNSEASQ